MEYLHWSPDGCGSVFGVAGHGADTSGGQGAVAGPTTDTVRDVPSWLPAIESGEEPIAGDARGFMNSPVIPCDRYPIRASTFGRPFGAVMMRWRLWCRPDPGRVYWYSARLSHIEIATGHTRELYVPQDQLGWPAASPSGKHLAIVKAVCSDRWLVAGDLKLIETASGKIQRVDTRGLDVTYTQWHSDGKLLLAGHGGTRRSLGYMTPDRTRSTRCGAARR